MVAFLWREVGTPQNRINAISLGLMPNIEPASNMSREISIELHTSCVTESPEYAKKISK
jgi:hypothetical protein